MGVKFIAFHQSRRIFLLVCVCKNWRGFLQTLPSPAGPAQHTESIRGIRGVAIALAERVGRGDTGEVCHWADGYHLNVRIYEKLLMSVFDVLDEGQLVEVSNYTKNFLVFLLFCVYMWACGFFNNKFRFSFFSQLLHDGIDSFQASRLLSLVS